VTEAVRDSLLRGNDNFFGNCSRILCHSLPDRESSKLIYGYLLTYFINVEERKSPI
jgi:hypothetical protein